MAGRLPSRLSLILSLCAVLISVGCGKQPTAPIVFPPEAQQPVHVLVEGTRARLIGTIDATTPDTIRALLTHYPTVETLVLEAMPGSDDNLAAFTAGRLVRSHGLKTHVPSDGVIASGGADLFIAGAVRTIEPGAHIGVHSWTATDGQGQTIWGSRLPRTDGRHQFFVTYYREMGISSEFYWFAIQAAPPSGVHWMTEAELQRFGVLRPMAGDHAKPGIGIAVSLHKRCR